MNEEFNQIVPTKKLNLMAHHLINNANKAGMEQQTKTDTLFGMFLGALHSYLFLLREEKIEPEMYEHIKDALQEITGWFIMGLNIETFEEMPANTERQLIFNVETKK